MSQSRRPRRSVAFDTSDPRAVLAVFRECPHLNRAELHAEGGLFHAVLAAGGNEQMQVACDVFGRACGDMVRVFRREAGHMRFSTPVVELGLIRNGSGWTVVIRGYETPELLRQLLQPLGPVHGSNFTIRYPVNPTGPLEPVSLREAIAMLP